MVYETNYQGELKLADGIKNHQPNSVFLEG